VTSGEQHYGYGQSDMSASSRAFSCETRIPKLVLASASPRRREILEAAGIAFEVMPSRVEEQQHAGEPPEQFVQRIAQEKALDVLARRSDQSGWVVLGADTAVVIDGKTLGKPADAADVGRMLRLLSGREHRVLTGVCLAYRQAPGVVADVRCASTTVKFAALSDAEIAEYAASSEPFDKAGAYAIQGRASKFVEWISGDYFNVVGLPVSLVYQMLREHREGE
jgi:septum formation protein